MKSHKEGKYLYGIIEADRQENFGPLGIGERRDEVTTIRFKDLAAVVSDFPIVEFDRFQEEKLKGLVAAHQRVNEAVLKTHSIVPMKFGNLADDGEAVKRILERTYIQLKAALSRIKDKVELVVQAFWNKQDLIQEIANTDEKLISLKKHLFANPSGNDLMAKLELGKALHEAVTAREKDYWKDLCQSLGNGGGDFVAGKLLGEEMIFNGSFLVERKRESDFDQKVQQLATRYNGKLNFKYIGPLPPYSFANLKLSLPDGQLIDQARRSLGLSTRATRAEIKEAYRKLAAQCHPDKKPEDSDAADQFKAVAEAYQILETYCQNYRYSFETSEVMETVLIRED